MKYRFLLTLAAIVACTFATAGSRYGIIPKPVSLVEKEGVFRITSKTVVEYPTDNERAAEIATDFAARLNMVSGLKVRAEVAGTTSSKEHLVELKLEEGMVEEGYELNITPQHISVKATTTQGLFWGIQSICQLLPAEVYGEKRVGGLRWEVPCCEVRDEPKLPYRGILLDCSRYFMPKETILKFIDIMSMHKQNMFHWHLTQDQGWRIEIKKYPRLTEVGAWRKRTDGYKNDTPDPNPHGGFYTQDDAREVVEYARRRGVTVVPEVGFPGHAMAAIAAYPELSCFPDTPKEVGTRWGVMKDVFCPSATTFQFLEDVFTELFDIFPSPYYNIGGDECPRDAWKESQYVQDFMKIMGYDNEDQVQIFFVERMARFLNKHGKKVIGWDEIMDGGVVPGTIVMTYRTSRPPVVAARKGLQAINASSRWSYMDYYQEDPGKEPKSQGLFLPLRMVYDYQAINDTVPEQFRHYIIGQQGCVWGEYIQTGTRAEYMAFPRAVAMSEIAWCDNRAKDWDSFTERMLKDFKRLDQRKINYSHAFWNVIFNFDRKKDGYPKEVTLTLDYPDAEIRYTTDGSKVTSSSPLYNGEIITVVRGDLIRAQGFLPNGKTIGVPVDKQFGEKEMSLPTW
jgi:hexosaminidase